MSAFHAAAAPDLYHAELRPPNPDVIVLHPHLAGRFGLIWPAPAGTDFEGQDGIDRPVHVQARKRDATDFDAGSDVVSAIIPVEQGTVNGDKAFTSSFDRKIGEVLHNTTNFLTDTGQAIIHVMAHHAERHADLDRGSATGSRSGRIDP